MGTVTEAEGKCIGYIVTVTETVKKIVLVTSVPLLRQKKTFKGYIVTV
jgi:hypothetical protein